MASVKDVLDAARAELGVTEHPPRSNNVKYNTEYYGREVYGDDAYPWCMVFVWWVFKKAGAARLFCGGDKTASCPTYARYSMRDGTWVTGGYRVGDVAIYSFTPGDTYQHTGIIERVNGDGSYASLEGNTSVTSDDNGGAVMRRTRYDSQITGACRPAYDAENQEEDDEVTFEQFSKFMDEYLSLAGTGGECSDWAREAVDWAIANGIFKGDGSGDLGWKKLITREAVAQALMNGSLGK